MNTQKAIHYISDSVRSIECRISLCPAISGYQSIIIRLGTLLDPHASPTEMLAPATVQGNIYPITVLLCGLVDRMPGHRYMMCAIVSLLSRQQLEPPTWRSPRERHRQLMFPLQGGMLPTSGLATMEHMFINR